MFRAVFDSLTGRGDVHGRSHPGCGIWGRALWKIVPRVDLRSSVAARAAWVEGDIIRLRAKMDKAAGEAGCAYGFPPVAIGLKRI